MDNMESQNQQTAAMDSKKSTHQRIKQFFSKDTSEAGRKLLAKEKRKIANCLQEMKETERTINMRKDFTIAGIVSYSFRIMNLPVDEPFQLEQIYASSLLSKQTFAHGKKCATPKVRFLSQCTEDKLRPRCYRCDQEIVLQIEIESGARLVLTTDGKFPEAGYRGSDVTYLTNQQRRFMNRCTLRMKAQKDGMIESNCLSFELRPNMKFRDQKRIRENVIRKSQARFDDSNQIEQSQIFWPS